MKCLFWNVNDSIVKFLLQAVFLCDTDLFIKIYQIMATTRNAENLRQYKSCVFCCGKDTGFSFEH